MAGLSRNLIGPFILHYPSSSLTPPPFKIEVKYVSIGATTFSTTVNLFMKTSPLRSILNSYLLCPLSSLTFHLSLRTSSSKYCTLLPQPCRYFLNRIYSSLTRQGLPTPSTAMALPIIHLSNYNEGSWVDADAIPTDDSMSNRPYRKSLGKHEVAPATPAVSAFLCPTVVKSSSLPPPTSSFPKMLRDFPSMLFSI